MTYYLRLRRWLQSQPIRQKLRPGEAGGGGGACASDESCNLNGVCRQSVCVCDPQWTGSHCGSLALLPADPLGGYRRPGFSGWGGNPWWDPGDKKCESLPALLANSPSDHDQTRAQTTCLSPK